MLVNAVAGAADSEAGCIRGETVGLEAVAEKDRSAAEPGMAEVPDLVTADQDGVVMAGIRRPVQAEAVRKRIYGKRRRNLLRPRCIGPNLLSRRALRQLRLSAQRSSALITSSQW